MIDDFWPNVLDEVGPISICVGLTIRCCFSCYYALMLGVIWLGLESGILVIVLLIYIMLSGFPN